MLINVLLILDAFLNKKGIKEEALNNANNNNNNKASPFGNIRMELSKTE